jgi:hypothetical protein
VLKTTLNIFPISLISADGKESPSSGEKTNVRLKKIMLSRPTLATALATTATKLGTKDTDLKEMAAAQEVMSKMLTNKVKKAPLC